MAGGVLKDLKDIRPGSCILWSGDYLISRAIRLCTGSKFSHASLVTSDPDLECAIVEAEATGLELRELRGLMDNYRGEVWLFTPDTLDDSDVHPIRQFAIKECASNCPYDYLGLFANIIKHTSIHARRYFCSAFVWAAWLYRNMVEGTVAPRPGEIPTRTHGTLERLA